MKHSDFLNTGIFFLLVPVPVFHAIPTRQSIIFCSDVAVKAVKFYKEFFLGVGYTLPKLDLVAVPDFYIGAMENWGLLTFRSCF